jgi:hypothetical protein
MKRTLAPTGDRDNSLKPERRKRTPASPNPSLAKALCGTIPKLSRDALTFNFVENPMNDDKTAR